MSNALAIATVTKTLVQVLNRAVSASLVRDAQVRALRPDASSGLPNQGVNIFLYQVTPNTAWRNADLPTRRSDGSPLRRPQVALDLHYLLTFYGDDTTLQQQRLLGTVARALHAAPGLQRTDIQKAEQTTKDPADQSLYVASRLSDQLDLIRFTPINFSLEEMYKLWSVLKTDYVLSIAYMASVVPIETDDPAPAGALPVLKPCIQAVPFSLARIDTIEPQAVELSDTGSNKITLHGQGLNAESAVAFITPGKADLIFGSIEPGSTSDTVSVTLPSGLRPGINTVQLIRTAPAGSLLECSPGVLAQSNAAAFAILPTITIDTASLPEHLGAVVSPAVGPQQQVSLLLNQLIASLPSNPLAFVLLADPRDTETDTFSFSTAFPANAPPMPSGEYLARVRVDTAESRLTVDAFGAFNGPLVNIP